MRALKRVCRAWTWLSVLTFVSGWVLLCRTPSEALERVPPGWSELAFARTILGAVAVIFAPAVLWSIYFIIDAFTDEVANARTLQRGAPARATITSVSDSGQTLNDSPVAVFQLLVTPECGGPFPAEARFAIPRLEVARYAAGVVVDVKFDPARNHVAIVGLADTEARPPSLLD